MHLFLFHAEPLLNPAGSRHVHADIEVLAVTSGRGRQLTAAGDEACASGDVFVFPPGCAHMSATGARESFSCVVLNLVQGDLPAEAGALLRTLSDRATGRNHQPVRAATGQRCAALLRRAEEEWASSALGCRAAAQALVVEAVIALARDDRQRAPTAGTAGGDHHLERAERWLEDYWMTPVRVADLVALGPLGRSQFLARFRKHTGRTVSQALMAIRLRQAQRMMRAARTTLLDVALACGFGSQSHFNHCFRQATGQSPRAWLAANSAAASEQG